MDLHDISHWCAIVTDFSLLGAVLMLHLRSRDHRQRLDAMEDSIDAVAPSPWCDVYTVDTGGCDREPGHPGEHRNDRGSWA